MKMLLEKNIFFNQEEVEFINNLLSKKTENDKEICLFSTTAKFTNGCEIDIKICGSDDSSLWTEAVLFDAEGKQICCTDAEDKDSFWEEWVIETEKNVYKINPKKKRRSQNDRER